MGHRFATFVTPIHAVHHRDPHAVFAIGAWLPALVPLIVGFLCHAGTFSLVYGGSLAGFAIYEAIHYRIHFCRPICDLETRLRARHLAHHYRVPTRCYGVTTPLWDLVFGTGVTDSETAWMRTNASRIPPLDGCSNLAAPGLALRRLIHGPSSDRRSEK
jgi:sterol desaturase/sphingolipid hydroxylase (fatty acid hydroxylase superfamily)